MLEREHELVGICCRVLCIRSGPSSGVHVYIQCSSADTEVSSADRRAGSGSWFGYPCQTPISPTLHSSTQAAGIRGPWREINLTCIDGRNFAQKLEAIVSCLMPDRTAVDTTI